MNAGILAHWLAGTFLAMSLFLEYHGLAQAGLDRLDAPIFASIQVTPTPAHALESHMSGAPPNDIFPASLDVPSTPSESTRNNGFTLAVIVLAGMVLSLLYALGCLVYGVFKDTHLAPPPGWQDWLFPILCVFSLAVAGYLSYIEISLSQAMCGPVGNCTAVQTSSYARLWGWLPIGVLGAGGYIVILAVWWASRQKWGWLSSYAPIALFGMTFFGTVFSAYLTYLEPFVIKAVCIWCITSAVIMTLLLLLSVHPTLRSLFGDPHSQEST